MIVTRDQSSPKSLAQSTAQLPLIASLKEQYPVTAHAPNFDFWTGLREIKRCEESKSESEKKKSEVICHSIYDEPFSLVTSHEFNGDPFILVNCHSLW